MRRVSNSPHASAAGIGRIFPYCFGIVKGLFGIPMNTGAQGALAETLSAGGDTIKLDNVDTLRTFGDTGTGQIEAERVTWARRDFVAVALAGATRGEEGTTAVEHKLGTEITEVIAEHRFGLYENPGVFRCKSIDSIYINGLLKGASVDPVHVAAVGDSTGIGDSTTGAPISVGTVTFDMSPVASSTSPFISPESLAATRTFFERRRAILERLRAQTEAEFAAFNAIYSLPPQTWPPGPVKYPTNYMGVVFAAPKLLPQLGAITADVSGLQDDSLGTITGSPGMDITNPAHCARLIMQEAFRQPVARFHAASWALAAQICADFGYRWDFSFLPMPFAAFQEFVYAQSRINIFLEGGQWRAVVRRPGPAIATLAPARRVNWSARWSRVDEVVPGLNVSHGQGDAQRSFVLPSSRGARLTDGQPGELSLPWIASDGSAHNLAAWQLGLRDHQRREGTAVMGPEAIGLTRMDIVAVDTPMLVPYGGTSLLWRIQAARVRPDAMIEISLEEEEAYDVSPGDMAVPGRAARRRLIARESSEMLAAEASADGSSARGWRRRQRAVGI